MGCSRCKKKHKRVALDNFLTTLVDMVRGVVPGSHTFTPLPYSAVIDHKPLCNTRRIQFQPQWEIGTYRQSSTRVSSSFAPCLLIDIHVPILLRLQFACLQFTGGGIELLASTSDGLRRGKLWIRRRKHGVIGSTTLTLSCVLH